MFKCIIFQKIYCYLLQELQTALTNTALPTLCDVDTVTSRNTFVVIRFSKICCITKKSIRVKNKKILRKFTDFTPCAQFSTSSLLLCRRWCLHLHVVEKTRKNLGMFCIPLKTLHAHHDSGTQLTALRNNRLNLGLLQALALFALRKLHKMLRSGCPFEIL